MSRKRMTTLRLDDDEDFFLRVTGYSLSVYVKRKISEDSLKVLSILKEQENKLLKELQEVRERMRILEGETQVFDGDNTLRSVAHKLYNYFLRWRENGETLEDIYDKWTDKSWNREFGLLGITRRAFLITCEQKYQKEGKK